MNNDVMPAGTWNWLASLGYERVDVERITAQRRLRMPGEYLHDGDVVFDEAQDFAGFKVVLDGNMPADEIRMVSNPGSEVPDWFLKLMLDNGFCSYSPPIIDAEPMSKDDIVRRREQGRLLHERECLLGRFSIVPWPIDQVVMYQEIADYILPE